MTSRKIDGLSFEERCCLQESLRVDAVKLCHPALDFMDLAGSRKAWGGVGVGHGDGD